MVDAMEWDYREPDYADLAQFPIIKELMKDQYRPKIIELNIQQEAPNAAAEILVNYTNIFDGTSTAAVLYYDSSSANDTAAGTGARTATILSVNEDGDDYQEITDDLAGMSGTATTEKHQRILFHKVASAGSGNTSAGNITLQDDAAGSNVYCTIAAGDLSSISARIYCPDNWKMQMIYIRAQVTEVNHATAAITADTGFIFYPIVYENAMTPDDPQAYAVSSSRSPVELHNVTTAIDSNGGANYISLKHVTKEDDNNSLALYKIIYLVWDTQITARGFLA